MAEDQQNEGQEKSFEASETKLRKAREQGNVPQSRELTTTLLYIGMLVALLLAGGPAIMGTAEHLSLMLARPEELGESFLFGADKKLLGETMMGISIDMLPMILIPAVFVLISLIAQQAIVSAPSKIKPKPSKISLISNAKQKYGPDGLMEFLKSFIKMLAITVIAGIFLWQQYYELPQLSLLPETVLPNEMLSRTVTLLIFVTLMSAAITAIDLPWVRFSHAKKLRMTLQEMRQENKENEGDPHQKQSRRRRAEALAMNTMLNDVAKADVIITNPEHYSVALKWDREEGQVPICVAKGVDEVAFRIRERAALADVPIRPDPPCARSLYATVEVGEHIRPEHYAAVAAAIHFADELRKRSW